MQTFNAPWLQRSASKYHSLTAAGSASDSKGTASWKVNALRWPTHRPTRKSAITKPGATKLAGRRHDTRINTTDQRDAAQSQTGRRDQPDSRTRHGLGGVLVSFSQLAGSRQRHKPVCRAANHRSQLGISVGGRREPSIAERHVVV